MSSVGNRLRAIKILHTVIWSFFVGCIVAIPILAWAGKYTLATTFIGIVFIEVLVLLINGWRCPLTDIAARYTDDRCENFDIYLPAWIASNNKFIFGILYVAGVLVTIILWAGWWT